MRNSMNCCCSPNMGRRDADKPVTPPLHQTVTTLVAGTCTKLLLGLWAWRPRLVNPHCGGGGRAHRTFGSVTCEESDGSIVRPITNAARRLFLRNRCSRRLPVRRRGGGAGL